MKTDPLAICPICFTQDDFCEHFIGWTRDRKEIIEWTGVPYAKVHRFDPEKHIAVETGIVDRVYIKE